MLHIKLVSFVLFVLYIPGMVYNTGGNGTVPPPPPERYMSDVFAGEHYRIPSIIASPDGTLLAVAEKRVSVYDPGKAGEPVGLVASSSRDAGASWSEPFTVAYDERFDYSDPRLVGNGDRLFLFYAQWSDGCGQNCTFNADKKNRLVYRRSDDNGETWSGESYLDKADWMRSINSGPGVGVVTTTGRMLFTATAVDMNRNYRMPSVYSDDSGATWNFGSAPPITGTTESDPLALGTGDILVTSRIGGSLTANRLFMVSHDDGDSWEHIGSANVQMTRVDASLVMHDGCVFLSGPSGPGRANLSVWRSCDDGNTFEQPILIQSGFAGYSAMVEVNGGIGILYEAEESTLIKFVFIAM